MSETDSVLRRGDDPGLVIAKFFAELDRRIGGARDTSAESAAYLARLRPQLWAQSQEDPESFVAAVWLVGAKYLEPEL